MVMISELDKCSKESFTVTEMKSILKREKNASKSELMAMAQYPCCWKWKESKNLKKNSNLK